MNGTWKLCFQGHSSSGPCRVNSLSNARNYHIYITSFTASLCVYCCCVFVNVRALVSTTKSFWMLSAQWHVLPSQKIVSFFNVVRYTSSVVSAVSKVDAWVKQTWLSFWMNEGIHLFNGRGVTMWWLGWMPDGKSATSDYHTRDQGSLLESCMWFLGLQSLQCWECLNITIK